MADLAALLLRTVARAFYSTEHILVIDALLVHSTLSDQDLAFALGGMQTKSLRKICGRLKEDGLVSVQTRAERRTDGSQSFYANSNNPRISHRDWYYLNFHRAIDSIKYRMYRLNKHIESLGAPTTEKKDYACPRCKAQYTSLEVLDSFDHAMNQFACKRCGHALDMVEEEEGVTENDSMKRLNSQLEKILRLMQQVDATTVPENDFQTALSRQKPIIRSDAHPGQQRTEVVDLPNRNLQSTRGMQIQPERIAVEVQDDDDVKPETGAADAQARREKEAKQNELPEWIVKSTVSGDITAAGAKEEQLRRERAANAANVTSDGDAEEKKPTTNGDEDVLAAYWVELAKANAEQAAREKDEEDEDDDDEDDEEFEDIPVESSTPLLNGTPANGVKHGPSGSNTPALESSNATDDEREVKRVRIGGLSEPGPSTSSNGVVASGSKFAEDTPTASDEDDDDLNFEDVS